MLWYISMKLCHANVKYIYFIKKKTRLGLGYIISCQFSSKLVLDKTEVYYFDFHSYSMYIFIEVNEKSRYLNVEIRIYISVVKYGNKDERVKLQHNKVQFMIARPFFSSLYRLYMHIKEYCSLYYFQMY